MCYYSERISLKVGILLVEVARMRCENHIKTKRTGRGYTLAKLEQTKHKYKYRVQGENYRNGSKNE